ncbi:putative protease [Ruminococcus sp. YE71]|uniref:U32 family peptidase n=1 Tax=unclassified Ruminococcus TaxID=2608920 RepID=UPI00088F96EA|nr:MULTISPECIES: U32 family peptidase [unclassified Ruminococcus]SDA15592.1 putative protease [Ruminococcus sp. YE78]SFW22838.1 putative protease [Ruminococcus sp. YE71]
MPEILSPAGGKEQAFAAVRSGADAVYLGLERFSARANATNFNEADLRETVKYCHERGVKVYAAVNTMLFDSELDELDDTLRLLCEVGIDAVISQDLAVVAAVRRSCPQLELHASTQMTLHTKAGCEFAEKLGFTRTVLSRELPEAVIAELSGGDMETEVFVHGALCMSVSGQCLMSAMVGGRSANRGACAQPCRLPCTAVRGKEYYALSLKDMSVLRDLPHLAELGVDSMKIEGRMKRPEYAALSANCAAKALAGEKYDEALLRTVFSRGGFTDGYLKGKLGFNMFGRRTADDSKAANAAYPKIHELYRRERKCSELDIFVTVREGEPVTVSALDENGLYAEYKGGAPEAAVNRPCDEELVRRQLSKLGDTFFEAGSFTCEIGEGLSVPNSFWGEARRSICAAITAQREEHYSRTVPFEDVPRQPIQRHDVREQSIRISAQRAEQLSKLDPDEIETAWLPLDTAELKKAAGLFPTEKLGAVMPRFTFNEGRDVQRLTEAKKLGIGKVLCTNFAHIVIAEKLGLEAHAAHGLNTANTDALGMLSELGVKSAVVSPEMKTGQINALGGTLPRGIIVYGRLPLMLTANCPISAQVGCKNCTHTLFDRTGRSFLVRCSKAQGYVEILNSDILSMSDKREDIRGADFLQIELDSENPSRTAEVVSLIRKCRPLTDCGHITRGLYYRGVNSEKK